MKKEQISVSVIIPVYDVEKYLPRCLESVLGQTLREIEVICIDDASPDRSGEILDEYAGRDSRVRVLHLPENHMQGYGRNRGLELASGRYVYFLDSDDEIREDALENMLRIAEKDDLDGLYFDSEAVYENEYLRKKYADYPEVRRGKYAEGVQRGADLMDAFFENREWLVYIQRQFWKRSFLIDNGIFSVEGIEHEDEYFSFLSAQLAERVRYVPERWFIRRFRENSVMTRAPKPKDFHGYFVTLCRMLEAVRKYGLSGPGCRSHIFHMYEVTNNYYSTFEGEDPGVWFRDPADRAQYELYRMEREYKDFWRKKENEFWQPLERYAGVHLYGAGRVAASAARRIQEAGCPVRGFLVSDTKGNPDVIRGIPVLNYRDAKIGRDEAVVAAMSRGFRDEVEPVLQGLGRPWFWYAANLLEGPFPPAENGTDKR